MHQGARQKGKPPLLVKEVILPKGQVSSGSSKNDKEIMEGSQEITCHRYKKADQHEPEVLSLMILEEKPLENYFEGTRKKKKIRERKTKHHRTGIPPTELSSNRAQTLSEGERKQTEKALSKEEETEIQLVSLRIYEYEKTREEAHRKNCVRQRKAEEDYIYQLETLTKNWFKTSLRQATKKKVDEDFTVPKFLENSSQGTSSSLTFPTRRKNSSNKRTKKKLSTSREHHSEDPVPLPGKSKKLFKEWPQPVQAQPSEGDLEEDFNEKLVFVDDESDEFDYTNQTLQFRNSSR